MDPSSKQITVSIPDSLKNAHQVLHPHAQGNSVTLSMDDDKVCIIGDRASKPVCLHRDASNKPNVTLLDGQRNLHCNDISDGDRVMGRVCWAWK